MRRVTIFSAVVGSLSTLAVSVAPVRAMEVHTTPIHTPHIVLHTPQVTGHQIGSHEGGGGGGAGKIILQQSVETSGGGTGAGKSQILGQHSGFSSGGGGGSGK
jgi:hypothetical protein